MISALARAAVTLGEPRYAAAAVRAAEFVLARLSNNDIGAGTLRRSISGGRLGGRAFLADYAMLIAAFLDLHEATQQTRWLDAAMAAERAQVERMVRETGDLVLWRDLNAHGSRQDIVSDVFGVPEWSQWRKAGCTLHLFLDSLDEYRVDLPNVVQVLIEQLG